MNVKYNIRLVHLLLEDDLDPQRQKKSIKQVERLASHGIDYVQVWNRRWTEEPPRDNFARPNMFDVVPISPAIYGCFRAFADGAANNFTEDLDAIILCEGDVKILNEDTIIDSIHKAYEATQEYGIDYFSLGSKYTLECGILQSATLEKHGDVEITNKIIGIQMIMFPQRIREYLLDVYANSPWDGADIFLNQNFMFKKKIGIFSESPTNQWSGISALEDRFRGFNHEEDNTKKLLYLAPHLSTGGMPQFVLARVNAMLEAGEYDVHVLENKLYSSEFVVQRNHIIDLLGDNFHDISTGYNEDPDDRTDRMIAAIDAINPDIIHIEECTESFDSHNKLTNKGLEYLYNKDANWKIVETCHNIWFQGKDKIYNPDAYIFCTPYHEQVNFKDAPATSKWLATYPIEDLRPTKDEKLAAKLKLGFDTEKIHVLNVGLWTSGKNQSEGVEIARIAERRYPGKFHFHFIGNQAPNFKDYWKPVNADLPSNVTIWHERDNVSDYMRAADAFMFNSTWECNPLALREAISYGLVTFSRNLEQYLDMFTPYIIPFTDILEENATILLESLTAQEKIIGDFIQPQNELERFTQDHLKAYKEIISTNGNESTRGFSGKPQGTFRLECQVGVRLHVDSLGPGDWHAEFWDGPDMIYKPTGLKGSHWYAPSRKWHTDWHVKIYHNGILYEELRWTLSGKEVLVQFDSSSLGDTLAFMGQMPEFKKQHGISKVLVRTHKNWLFDHDWYAAHGIEIVDDHKRTAAVQMNIGVYYNQEEPWDRNQHKYDWRLQTLAKIASDRLGIFYIEKRPQLAREFLEPAVQNKKSIVIATHSTAQAKYWNHPTGWQDLTNYWNKEGYEVLHSSKEGTNLKGVKQLPEGLADVAKAIRQSEMFIGISSGLSWFAWALEAKVVIISGFTDPYVEFKDAIYVNNHQVCHGCWGAHVFDKGDWNWCPVWKGTRRQFECTKTITAASVIKQIESWELNK